MHNFEPIQPQPAITAESPALPANGDTNTWRQLITAGADSTDLLPATLKSGQDKQLKAVTRLFPMRINAYFQSLISSAVDPLGLQVIPRGLELEDLSGPEDPLAEDAQSPVGQVIHRYPHRVAFLVSNQCAVYCRFCMRKRRVGEPTQVAQAGNPGGCGVYPQPDENQRSSTYRRRPAHVE